MKTITIKNSEYKLNFGLKSIFIFEKITNKPFNLTTTFDFFIYFYSVLACDENFNITIDELNEICDEDGTLLHTFVELYVENLEAKKIYKEEDTDKKKMK